MTCCGSAPTAKWSTIRPLRWEITSTRVRLASSARRRAAGRADARRERPGRVRGVDVAAVERRRDPARRAAHVGAGRRRASCGSVAGVGSRRAGGPPRRSHQRRQPGERAPTARASETASTRRSSRSAQASSWTRAGRVAAADDPDVAAERRGARSDSATGSRPARPHAPASRDRSPGSPRAGWSARRPGRRGRRTSRRARPRRRAPADRAARPIVRTRPRGGIERDDLRARMRAVGAAGDQEPAADRGDGGVAQRMRQLADDRGRAAGPEREHRAQRHAPRVAADEVDGPTRCAPPRGPSSATAAARPCSRGHRRRAPRSRRSARWRSRRRTPAGARRARLRPCRGSPAAAWRTAAAPPPRRRNSDDVGDRRVSSAQPARREQAPAGDRQAGQLHRRRQHGAPREVQDDGTRPHDGRSRDRGRARGSRTSTAGPTSGQRRREQPCRTAPCRDPSKPAAHDDDDSIHNLDTA